MNQNETQTASLTVNWPVRHIVVKRAFDVVFSLGALIVCAPLFLLIFLGIRLTSAGKAVYTHERVGREGKPFHCYKFRTMYADADMKLQALLKEDTALRDEWNQSRKLKSDPRITWIGALLRKTSLDELPQFWNVLKGDMSVVGPRPVVQAEIDNYYVDHAPKILSIRPGITGLWQVSGRSNTTYAKRIELDDYYVENHSLLMDITLIFKTVPTLIKPNGAY